MMDSKEVCSYAETRVETVQRLWHLRQLLPEKVLEITEVGKCAIIPGKEDDCIQCGQCELRCPDYAIFVEKDK